MLAGQATNNIVLNMKKKSTQVNQPQTKQVAKYHMRHTSSQQEQFYRKSLGSSDVVQQQPTQHVKQSTIKINQQGPLKPTQKPVDSKYTVYSQKSRSSVPSPTASFNSQHHHHPNNNSKHQSSKSSVVDLQRGIANKSMLQGSSHSKKTSVQQLPQMNNEPKRQIVVKNMIGQQLQQPLQHTQKTSQMHTPQSTSPKQYQTPPVQSIKITKAAMQFQQKQNKSKDSQSDSARIKSWAQNNNQAVQLPVQSAQQSNRGQKQQFLSTERDKSSKLHQYQHTQSQQLILLQKSKQPPSNNNRFMHARSQSQIVNEAQIHKNSSQGQLPTTTVQSKQGSGYRSITPPLNVQTRGQQQAIAQTDNNHGGKDKQRKGLVTEFELFQNILDHSDKQKKSANKTAAQANEPLMTEEDEQVFRQVASDINENAFFGKQMKRIQSASTNPSKQLQLSPRSLEIVQVMAQVKEAFLTKGEAPLTMIDFYRVGKMLGRGAFGKVNLAMHKLVRKLVALKSLNKEILTDKDQKMKLLKEVNLLLKLRHAHVVKIYETIETEKHIVIVMELCAGGDLLNYVRRRRKLKEPIALKIFKQIIDGLCYIHGKNIAHRDIKLDNILLDGVGNVKIGDFGVSKQINPQQMMFEQCGTPAYIAPEILRNKGYSLSVDLWSAGVVLFAMLYGSVPFKGQSMEELHELILNGRYLLKEDISKDAVDLLRGLLEINPQKRLTIKQIYQHPWLQNYDASVKLFTHEECELINKEYTYNHPSRYQDQRRNESEPADGFTEQNIESLYSEMKNNTTKSIILAPFNSTMTLKTQQSLHFEEDMFASRDGLVFSKRCREVNRQYEFNNNGQLDNGVYHKQLVQNSFERQEQELKGDESTQGIQVEQKLTSSKPGYNGGNIVLENDEQMAAIYETFQKHNNNKLDKQKIERLTQFGYPRAYVETAVKNLEPNYCTAGYYLIDMVQNYC